MHYYMHFGKDNMNTFLYSYQFFDSPEMWRKIPLLHSKIPKAFSVFMLGKNKECFGKPDKFRKFSLAFFSNLI